MNATRQGEMLVAVHLAGGCGVARVQIGQHADILFLLLVVQDLLVYCGEARKLQLLTAEAETEKDAGILKYYGAVLASFGETSVEPLLALFASENAAARGMAGAALEKIGEPALDPLLAAANSENQTVKICAGIVLMKLGVYNY